MKKILTILLLTAITATATGQSLSGEQLLHLAELPANRVKGFLNKKGYSLTDKEQVNDSVLSNFIYKHQNAAWNGSLDSNFHSVLHVDYGTASHLTYTTGSPMEFDQLLAQYQETGFYCNESSSLRMNKPLLFQHHETAIKSFTSLTENQGKRYHLTISRTNFPAAKKIYFADDLLVFNSHEQLVYYFGKDNVKSDIYYFSDNEIAKCSVLFSNTRRQVVFIWEDEVNRCTIAHLLFGGQQKLESAASNDRFIAENSWVFKSGIRPGMSLMELRRLNGSNFDFYGGNTAFSGSVVDNNNGRLNFKKENVILSCMNCNDYNFSGSSLISADDAIVDQRILFVLSVALNAREEPK